MASIILAAGGTGGHIFPALAVAEILQANGHDVTLFTDKRGAPMVEGKLSYRLISSASPFKKGLVAKVTGLISLGIGFMQTLAIMGFARPKAVIGFGGYPSLAPLLAGRLLGARCILHEQNAVMGRANRLLAKMAHHIALSFTNTKGAPDNSPTTLTGMPVRSAFTDISAYQPQDDRLHITIIGGSLGASIFAEIIPQAIALLPANITARLHVTQQARNKDIRAVKQAYDTQNISSEVARFYHDIPALYQASDIIISRAGASSVQEIATAGRASLLIPFAGALDDHQTGNASMLVDAKGAVMMAEKDVTAQTLAASIAPLLADSSARQKMAHNAKQLAKNGASYAIASLTELPLNDAVTGARL